MKIWFTEIEPAGYKLLSKVKVSNIDSELWKYFFEEQFEIMKFAEKETLQYEVLIEDKS